MGGDEREVDSTHATYESALQRCRQLVEDAVRSLAASARSPEELLQTYLAMGPEPFIDPVGDPPFVVRQYAEQLCRRLFPDDRRTE